jgi:rhodanese-related sulfurtransferase
MTIPAITMEELRRWLADGRPVSVLDVRQAANRAEWSIPGSRHADAYDALWARDPDALKDVDLPMNRPVVTVCNLGKTSLIAAEQLQARGYEVLSLVDGMKGWSLAWNEAALDLPAAAGRASSRCGAPARGASRISSAAGARPSSSTPPATPASSRRSPAAKVGRSRHWSTRISTPTISAVRGCSRN